MKTFLLNFFVVITMMAQAQTWQVNNSFVNGPLADIYFINPAIGFVVGDGNNIYRTIDAGSTWIATPSPNVMQDLEFPGPSVGYACGSSGAFMKTSNAGATWTTIAPWTTNHLREMSFISQDTGFVLGYNPSNFAVTIWKTVDGAASWTAITTNLTNNTCHDIYFVNSNVGFVASMGGMIVRSTYDGGTTWNTQNLVIGSSCLGLDFINDSTGFAVGAGGNIFRTTDQGLSWTSVASPTTEILRTVFFVDSLNGWASGYTGTILHTINGGLTWNIQPSPVTDQIINMFMFSPIYGWAVTGAISSGDVLRYGSYYQSDSANIIHGNVYADYNANCNYDAGDGGQINWFVTATPGPFYAVTDTAGNYSILVPPGTYSVTQILPTAVGLTVTPCTTPSYTITFPAYNDDTTGFDFINSVSLCPYLVTDIASDRRRRCRRNTTQVYYWNLGYTSTANAEVHVRFPEYVVPITSSVPWILQPDSTYLFNVGVILPQTMGTITITDSVVCGMDSIRGFTQCTEAWITPWNTCPAPSAQWDGSNIEASGKCLLNGYLRFTLKNNGLAMNDSAEYRVYINSQLARTRNYMLGAGDSINIVTQTNGQTFRIEADQHADHPAKTQTNASIEGCTVDITGNYVTGYIPQLPPDEEDAETSIHCLPIIDAFDPNEKTVEPGGVTAQHLVQPGHKLEYLIHFQNCGSDTAFDIYLIDTLSPYLDVTTMMFGAASHPYTASFLPGPMNIVKFTFSNILLPDSTTNEPGSNGFVSYSIYPDSACPLNTVVENFADIYFDFNLPVRTDTAWIQYSIMQPTTVWNEDFSAQWPLVIGPDTVCAGDTAYLFVLGDGAVWWSTLSNPNDTICTGYTLDTVVWFTQSFIAHTSSGNDTFVVEVAHCTNVVPDINSPGISLVPNPANDQLEITLSPGQLISGVSIYNANGQLVYAQKENSSIVVVSTDQLASGVYTVLITLTDSQRIARRLVIAH